MNKEFVLKHSTVIVVSILAFIIAIQNVSADGSWSWVRNTVTGAWGECVIGNGDAIYVARKSSFYMYSPAHGTWTTLASPPNPDSGDAFKTGTVLAWDFSNHLYAMCGASSSVSRRWFYRYDISLNSWEVLANTTVDQGEGNALTWVDDENAIYATIGGEQRSTHFMRYSPLSNSWSDSPSNPPDGMGDGASLVWTGEDFVYALRGEFDEQLPLCDFWRYSLSANTWTVMADIPANPHSGGVGGVGDGGSLLYVGFWLSGQTDYIYGLSGNQAYPESPAIPDNRTYRYIISNGSWERLADLPFGVGYYVGSRLGYADGHIYAWQGTPSTWEGGGDDLTYYTFPPPSHYFLGISPAIGGITNPPPGTYQYAADSSTNVTASPNTGYSFDYWLLDGWKTTQNPVLFNMDTNHTLIPYFIDNIAPEISELTQEPSDSVLAFENVTVTAVVSDFGTGIHNVTLWFSTNNGTNWSPLNMTRIPSDIYQAVIPGYENCNWISYKIVACDNYGNCAIDDNHEYLYTYHVIPEFRLTITSILPLLLMFLGTLLLRHNNKPACERYICHLCKHTLSLEERS